MEGEKCQGDVEKRQGDVEKHVEKHAEDVHTFGFCFVLRDDFFVKGRLFQLSYYIVHSIEKKEHFWGELFLVTRYWWT